jgi:hypothetical protein
MANGFGSMKPMGPRLNIAPSNLGGLIQNKIAHIPRIRQFGLKNRKPRLGVSEPRISKLKI